MRNMKDGFYPGTDYGWTANSDGCICDESHVDLGPEDA
jgi:hypothetical protein